MATELWTPQMPDKPGFYWVKNTPSSTPEVAHFLGMKKWLWVGIHASANGLPALIGPRVSLPVRVMV